MTNLAVFMADLKLNGANPGATLARLRRTTKAAAAAAAALPPPPPPPRVQPAAAPTPPKKAKAEAAKKGHAAGAAEVAPPPPMPVPGSENGARSENRAGAPVKKQPVKKKKAQRQARSARAKRQAAASAQRRIKRVAIAGSGRTESPLKFGDAEVWACECAACTIDRQVWRDGAEARGLVHSLFALDAFFKRLFELYRDAFANASVDTSRDECGARVSMRGLLADYGIDWRDRCSALIAPFESGRPLRSSRADGVVPPMVCPNVRTALRTAWNAMCGGVSEAASAQDVFFEQVIVGTLVYWHEAGQRRAADPADRSTLAALEYEYTSAIAADDGAHHTQFRALDLQRQTRDFLARCDVYALNQRTALTRLRDSEHPGMVGACDALLARVETGAADELKLDDVGEYLCALLRSPAVEPSCRDYWWPGEIALDLTHYRIVDDGSRPHLVDERSARQRAPVAAPVQHPPPPPPPPAQAEPLLGAAAMSASGAASPPLFQETSDAVLGAWFGVTFDANPPPPLDEPEHRPSPELQFLNSTPPPTFAYENGFLVGDPLDACAPFSPRRRL